MDGGHVFQIVDTGIGIAPEVIMGIHNLQAAS